MLKEFKEFAPSWQCGDLAVGVIIGAGFGKIVTSLTNDVIMPVVGLLMGKVDFSELFVNLGSGHFSTLKQATEASAPVLKYGVFINTSLDFLILAFVIFLMVRAMNRMKAAAPAPAPRPLLRSRYC